MRHHRQKHQKYNRSRHSQLSDTINNNYHQQNHHHITKKNHTSYNTGTYESHHRRIQKPSNMCLTHRNVY